MTEPRDGERTFVERLDLKGFVDRVMSTSVLAALVDDVRADVEAEVRAIAADWPALIRHSYVTDVFFFGRS